MISMRRKAKTDDDDEKDNARNDYDTKSQDSEASDVEYQKPEVGTCFVVAMIVAVIACIIDVIALALPWWTYSRSISFGSEIRVNSGLWSVCKDITPAEGTPSENCAHISEPKDYVLNARSCNAAGVALMGLGVIVSMIYKFWQTHLHLLLLAGGALFTIAGLLTWVIAVVFSMKFAEERAHSASELHACCYLSLVAGVTYHVVCILAVFTVDRTKVQPQPTP